MPGRTKEGARVSRLYKQKMADLAKGVVKEDKVEKKVDKKEKKEKKEKKDKSKLERVTEIFDQK